MRLAPLPLLLLAACGDAASATASASATDGATDTTGAPPPNTGAPTDATSEPPTGSGGATDGGTTTTASSSDASTTTPVHTATTDASTTTSSSTSTTTADSSTGADTTDTTADTGTTTDDVEACPCPDIEVPLDDGIFVLGDTGDLWKYFPEENMFEPLGELGCDLQPPTFSMAVDRLGYAWVEYPSGALRKVAVTDVTDCTDPGYPIGQQGVQNFGMAFVSNSAFDKCDRIHGSEYSGFPMNDFFDIDPMTLQLTKHGPGTPSAVSEVTGTGDGRAFLFSSTFPPTLVEVDKTTGAVLETIQLPQIDIGSGLAFAFFGGDFYFFTDGQSDFKSEVTHMDHDDSDMDGQKQLTQVFNDAPLRILGAGVSTCVPTLPQ